MIIIKLFFSIAVSVCTLDLQLRKYIFNSRGGQFYCVGNRRKPPTTCRNCRYGKDISTVCWNRVLQESDMKNIAVLVDLMLTLPPTSVRCETAFSQLKLLKTCRRSRLGQGVLNDLMAVKLLSPSVLEFNPDSSIQKWQVIIFNVLVRAVLQRV